MLIVKIKPGGLLSQFYLLDRNILWEEGWDESTSIVASPVAQNQCGSISLDTHYKAVKLGISSNKSKKPQYTFYLSAENLLSAQFFQNESFQARSRCIHETNCKWIFNVWMEIEKFKHFIIF